MSDDPRARNGPITQWGGLRAGGVSTVTGRKAFYLDCLTSFRYLLLSTFLGRCQGFHCLPVLCAKFLSYRNKTATEITTVSTHDVKTSRSIMP